MFKIGSFEIKNPFVLAPMAGVSQMPFRRLAIKMGAGLAPTELVSAKGLLFDSLRTKSYLTYDRDVEKPFCVQLFGGDIESMAIAAEKATAMGADILDINMGCPVKKVTKINAGSALLCDYERAASIVTAMLKQTGNKIPITAKIRSGWDETSLNFLEVGKALEEAGIAALAIHARTRAQGYSGKANWQHIAELKDSLSIPVIGNGDVTNASDAKAMQKLTGCDAVMIGRAALGNPWIFRGLCAADYVPDHNEYRRVIHGHLSEHISLHRIIADAEKRPFTEHSFDAAIRSFRSHLIWYSKGWVLGAGFRNAIMTTTSYAKITDLIDEFFAHANISPVSGEQDEEGIDYRQAFG